jgi:hypothetical protein
MPDRPIWEPFDGARWMREHYAEMDRLTKRFRDPGQEIREMQAGMQRQFEELRDPLRGLRETYRQIAEKFGLPPGSGFARPEPERIIAPRPPLRVIVGGLASKPRRGRPPGYMSPQTAAVMLAVDFYFEMVADPPRSERAIRYAVVELADKHGLGSLDPEGHTLREAVKARREARKLVAAIRGKEAAE